MDKKTFRKIYRDKRNALSPKELLEKSRIIEFKIINSQFYNKAHNIFTYLNYGNEIVTTDLINKALNDGKNVALPLMGNEKGKMDFIKIDSIENLNTNKYGIKEPAYDKEKVLFCDENTLVIVPLLAYNSKKYRIGYGGGYYDRFICANKALAYIGMGFDWQKDENLPVEEFDCKLDYIFTDKGNL